MNTGTWLRYYYTRDDYHTKPMFPLTGVNIGRNDYVAGPLEDWTKGALRFNGREPRGRRDAGAVEKTE